MVTTSMSNSGESPDEPNKNRTPEPAPRTKGSVPTPKMRRGPKAFLNEVMRELKKVTWPTKVETNRLTGVVLTVCILMGVILSAMGFVFGLVIDFITKGQV